MSSKVIMGSCALKGVVRPLAFTASQTRGPLVGVEQKNGSLTYISNRDLSNRCVLNRPTRSRSRVEGKRVRHRLRRWCRASL